MARSKQSRFFACPVLMLALLSVMGGCTQNQPATTGEKKYAFWPSPPDEPRVQFLTSYVKSSDVAPARSQLDEMLYGKEAELPINKPYGVGMWDGRVYVCDLNGQGVTVLDLKKQQTKVIGTSGEGRVERGCDIAISPDGMKYVVDLGRGAIVVFDANDRFVFLIQGADFSPVSAAVWGNELFVCDMKAQIIKVVDRTSAKLLRTIGGPGEVDGTFSRPLCVRLDKQGELFVVDVLRCRIQKFSRDGKLLLAFGSMGDLPGDFVRPKHLAMDQAGRLYIVDAAFSNVQVFDESGKVLMYFGSPGAHQGAMDLPAGIYISENPAEIALFEKQIHPAFQAERLIVIGNQFGARKVAVYAQGRLREGKTLADISSSRAAISAGMAEPGAAPTTQSMGAPIIPPDATETTEPTAAPATQPTAPAIRLR